MLIHFCVPKIIPLLSASNVLPFSFLYLSAVKEINFETLMQFPAEK